MELSLYILLLFFHPLRTISGPIYNSTIPVNFTVSYLQFVDNTAAGAFLSSPAGSFQARITNSKFESRSFYFVIVHVLSNTIIWSANRNRPISQSSKLRLTPDGLTIYNDSLSPIWSTTSLHSSSVSSMRLLESGDLVLLDSINNTVWESFDFPSDVLVLGQKLPIGKTLISNSNADDLSEGGYKLEIENRDAVLLWNGVKYWKFSMEKSVFIDTNFEVEYMMLNETGVLCLIGGGGRIVMSVAVNNFNSSDFHTVKLNDRGALTVMNYDQSEKVMKEGGFRGPFDFCRIPYICRRLGVCSNGGSCSCPAAFHPENGDCAPTDASLVLPGPCNGTLEDDKSIMYLSLRNNLDYFSNYFAEPVLRSANLSDCQSLCTGNCSCLGVFYDQGFRSCYMVRSYFGSLVINLDLTDRVGFVKAVALRSSGTSKKRVPVVAVVLISLSGIIVVIIVVAAVMLVKRRRRRRKRGTMSINSKFEMEFVSIPGLPVRIDYKELEDATDGFRTQIGSGGFGTVYRGTLGNGTEVAVKKITCMGAHLDREFLTEIAVIGKIHHVNLVSLKGFCAQRGERLLVYEFMKRGSLDRTLFGGDPVLEWTERYEIALGMARGLAYLHSGCEHKIIHCDVKPENVLLHDTCAKISDFGLSKLLSPEQSGLFTTMRGTRGYLAPEWLTSSTISDKTDVYSYGMVLLEIVRGRKNSSPYSSTIDSSSSSSSGETGPRLVYFPLFALEMHEAGRYVELVDPRLSGRVRRNEAEKLIRVALCCVHQEPSLRPSMTNVVGMLEGVVPLGEPQAESLNFLRFYGRRFTEESRLEENGSEGMYRQVGRTNATSSTSYDSNYSHISSHQVSGPR